MFVENKIFSTFPFEKPFSKEFIYASKEGNIGLIGSLLKVNKFLVFDFDQTHKSALHWATIRSRYSVMELLLNNHSDPDCQDITRKRCLYYACSNHDRKAVDVILLSDTALTWG